MAVRTIDLTSPSPLVVLVAAMKRKHLRSVVQIEQQVYPQPWTMSLFMSELALRSNRSYCVAKVGDAVVGYTGFSFLDDEAHITNIAVDPVWQRNGIATRLMVQNMLDALHCGVRHVTLEVRVGGAGAQALYHRFGFAPSGIRKNYYENSEDALIMWANDIDSDDYQHRLSDVINSVRSLTIAEALS